MGILDFLQRAPRLETVDVPLFPLNTVLFPGGLLSLKVFEQRYLDMAAACLKNRAPFGVCLIEGGSETGAAARPHAVGTLAEITSSDMEQLGILLLTVRGGRRFRIREQRVAADQLLTATVELLPEAAPCAVPAQRQRLLPLLERIIGDIGKDRIAEPYRLDDAEWVGCRITEVLPIQNLAKQKLLELDDPLVRLEILEKYLDQRRLLS